MNSIKSNRKSPEESNYQMKGKGRNPLNLAVLFSIRPLSFPVCALFAYAILFVSVPTPADLLLCTFSGDDGEPVDWTEARRLVSGGDPRRSDWMKVKTSERHPKGDNCSSRRGPRSLVMQASFKHLFLNFLFGIAFYTVLFVLWLNYRGSRETL